MDPIQIINERVDVVAVFQKQARAGLLCKPYRLLFRGRQIELKQLALRHPTVAGKRMIHDFDMSDGVNDYRLEFDAEALTWTLIAILEGHYAAN